MINRKRQRELNWQNDHKKKFFNSSSIKKFVVYCIVSSFLTGKQNKTNKIIHENIVN